MSEGEGMKRSADDEMSSGGSPVKRSRTNADSGKIELRVLIQSKDAGAIIGRGGSNITRLRTDYKASITVPDCPGPERILTISADLDVVCDVLMDVIPKLDDEDDDGSDKDGNSELHMLVHQSQAGCIIGRAGFKIKELREKTGATIKVYSNCCPQSTDRVVQISGAPKVVVESTRQIFDLIQQSPIKGANNPYDPHNCDEYYAHEYGGFTDSGSKRGTGRPQMPIRGGGGNPRGGGRVMRGGGGGGGMNDMPRGRMGGRGAMGNGLRDMGRRPMGPGRGPPMPPPKSQRGFRNSGVGGGRGNFGGRGRPHYGGQMGGGGGGGRGGGNLGGMGNGLGGGNSLMNSSLMGGGQNFNQGMGNQDMGHNNFGHNNQMGGNSTTTQVTIPKDLAGSIIGKGGARIRKIRQDSGAGITIDEALPGAVDRIITITGMPSQIQMAQYLLQQRNAIKC